MKVLVTGASGFLGGWLTRRLVDSGFDVSILTRKTADLSELDGLPVKKLIGDVTDPASVTSAVAGMDSVFHLAGLIAYSRADRPAMQKVNVDGTKNVVDAVAKSKVKRLLHVSSVVTIGASLDGAEPLTEDSNYNMGHLNLGYFETKLEAERLVVDACRAGHIDAVIVNPSTMYGAADAKKGSRHSQLKVARGEFPFYSDGGVNVVPVENAVEGMMAAFQKGKNGERYILSGHNFTIKELFAIISKTAGVKPPRIYLPTALIHQIGRVGDLIERAGFHAPMNFETSWTSTLYHWFDSSKAQRELGFVPGDATKAIVSSVEWMKAKHYLD